MTSSIKKTAKAVTKKKSASTMQAKSANNTAQSKIPGVVDLLRSSWSLVTNRFGALLGLGFVNLLLQISIVVTVVMGALFAGASSAFQAYMGGTPPNQLLTPELLNILGTGFVVLMAAVVVESVLMQITILRVLFNPKEAVMLAFRKSVSLFLPVLGTSLLISFITIGGMWLLIVPGFIFSIWFMFAVYEVALYGASGMVALERSAAVVRRNFWSISGRFGAMILLTLFIGSVFDGITASLSEDLQIVAELAGLLYQALIGWIWLAYVGTMYQSIRDERAAGQSVTLALMVAAIGWAVAGLFVWSVLKNSGSEILDRLNALSETSMEQQVEGVPDRIDESWQPGGIETTTKPALPE